VPPTNLPDYTYWNAGVSYTWKNLTADVRYHDTNAVEDASASC
jgi:hypothetical protein